MKKQLLALLFILGAVFNINATTGYVKVTSLDEITNNDKLIFVSATPLKVNDASNYYVVNTVAASGLNYEPRATALEGWTTLKNKFAEPDGFSPSFFNLDSQTDGTYAWYSLERSAYLYAKTATTMRTVSYISKASEKLIIEITNGVASIHFSNSTTSSIAFYATATQVSCKPYSNSSIIIGDSYANVAIYKQVSDYVDDGGDDDPQVSVVNLAFDKENVEATVGQDFSVPTLTATDKDGNVVSDVEVSYSVSSVPSGAVTIDASTGAVTITSAGTATITASVTNTDKYVFTSASYKLTVSPAPVVKTTFIVNGGKATVQNSRYQTLQDLNEDNNEVDLSGEAGKIVYIYPADGYELVSVVDSNGNELPLGVDGEINYASFTADDAACALSYTITVKKPVVLTKITVTGGSAILYDSNKELIQNLAEEENKVDLSAMDDGIVYIYPAEGYELVSAVNDFEKALDMGTDEETRFASLSVNEETRRREYTVTVRAPQTEPAGVKFTITEGSAAEIWKYSGGMSKWKDLPEEENIVDFSNEYQWGYFYIIPAEGQILKSIIDENGNNVSFSTGSAVSGRNTYYLFAPGNLGKSYTITTQKELTTIDFIVSPGSKALLYTGTRLIQELNEGSNPIDIRSYTQACYIYAAEGYELTSVVRRNQDGSDTQMDCDTEDLGSYIAGLYSYATVNTTLDRQAVSYTITTKKLGGNDDDEIGDIVGPFTAMFNFSDLESLKEVNGTTYSEGSWIYTDHALVIEENKGVKLSLSGSEQFGADHLIMRGNTTKWVYGQGMVDVPAASLIISQNHANIYITAVEIVYADGNTGAFITADKGILSNNGTSWVDALPAEANGPAYATPQGKITSVSLTPEAQTLVKGVNVTYMSTTTGIEEINTEANDAEPVYFDLQGRRVKNPGNGLYIRVIGNKADKVVIR